MSIIHQEPPYEDKCRTLIAKNPNMLVPWYLMASHAEHCLNYPIISGKLYDEIRGRLLVEWDTITHVHKDCIDRDALSCCLAHNLN